MEPNQHQRYFASELLKHASFQIFCPDHDLKFSSISDFSTEADLQINWDSSFITEKIKRSINGSMVEMSVFSPHQDGNVLVSDLDVSGLDNNLKKPAIHRKTF